MSNMFSLKERNIVITGGYGHLGKAMSSALISSGANLVVLGRSEEKFIKSGLESSEFIQCDISSTQSVKRAVSKVKNKFGKIDVLINNAFFCVGGNPRDMTDEDWGFGIEGSLNSVYRCIREFTDIIKKGGSVINISSMYGIVSPDFRVYKENPQFINPPSYGAAKAGVIQLTKYFATLMAQEGIRVNSISPGAFPSPEVQKSKSFIDALVDKIPMKRIGEPEDLSGTIVFLSSRASEYITGQNIIVDGGWTAV